jgi:hypothetical protein
MFLNKGFSGIIMDTIDAIVVGVGLVTTGSLGYYIGHITEWRKGSRFKVMYFNSVYEDHLDLPRVKVLSKGLDGQLLYNNQKKPLELIETRGYPLEMTLQEKLFEQKFCDRELGILYKTQSDALELGATYVYFENMSQIKPSWSSFNVSFYRDNPDVEIDNSPALKLVENS